MQRLLSSQSKEIKIEKVDNRDCPKTQERVKKKMAVSTD